MYRRVLVSACTSSPHDNVPADPPASPLSEKTTTRVTEAGKDALYALFTGPPMWARNTTLPRVNTNTNLDTIISKYYLRRDQADCQVQNWKGVVYEHTQVTLITKPGDVESSITDSLSMPFAEYITTFLEDLLSGKEVVPASLDPLNLCGMTKTQSLLFKAALVFLWHSSNHGCNNMLVMYLKQLSAMASEIFPNTATKMLDVELCFGVGIERWKEVKIQEWMGFHSTVDYGSTARILNYSFGHLGIYLSNVLYAVWSLLFVDKERLEIEIVTTDLPHKRSLPVVHYVDGWTLQRASQ